jgi:phospholipid/cholesterol/gamma-HCH transport system substrate-binding protein
VPASLNSQASHRQTLRAGLFSLVAIALFTATALWVAGSEWVRGASTPYTVRIAHAGTLATGDPVMIAGVAVGTVAGMRLDADAALPVRLRIEIIPDITVRADSTARVVLLDLLGGTALEVDPGSQRAQPLRPGGDVNGVASAGTQSLLNRADQVAGRTLTLMKRMESIFSDLAAQTPVLLRHTDRAATRAVRLLNQSGSAIAQLERLSTKLIRGFDDQGERLTAVLEEARAAFRDARAAATVVSDNRPVIERTLATLSRAAADLEGFTEQIKARPYSLIRVLPSEDRVPGEPAGSMP